VLRRSERADMFTPVTNVRIRDAVLFMHVTPIVRNPVVTYPVAHLVAHLVARLPTAVCVAERKPPRSKRRQLVYIAEWKVVFDFGKAEDDEHHPKVQAVRRPFITREWVLGMGNGSELHSASCFIARFGADAPSAELHTTTAPAHRPVDVVRRPATCSWRHAHHAIATASPISIQTIASSLEDAPSLLRPSSQFPRRAANSTATAQSQNQMDVGYRKVSSRPEHGTVGPPNAKITMISRGVATASIQRSIFSAGLQVLRIDGH
jgi:hypothetical protein